MLPDPAHRAALMASDLFRAMRPTEVDAVLARATLRRVARQEVVLRRGDSGAVLFLVLQGRLRVSMVSADGGEVTLGLLGPGEVLGEIALLDGKARSADVEAIEPGVLLSVERAHILPLLRANGDLCLRLMAVLCRRLRNANESLEEVALLDLPARVARVLGRLGREFGTRTPAGIRIGPKLSQTDIAQMAGASREKVNRELRALEAQGTIAKRDGHLLILRPADLAEAA